MANSIELETRNRTSSCKTTRPGCRCSKKERNETMSNRMYDILKWVAQVFLPALGTLYFALAATWGLPYAEQVVGTITAADTFLGVLLGISTAQYNKTKIEK